MEFYKMIFPIVIFLQLHFMHSSFAADSVESFLNGPVDLFKNVKIPSPPKSPFGDIIKIDGIAGVPAQLLRLISNKDVINSLFNNFKMIFNKDYEEDENPMRQKLFVDKIMKVVNHNTKARIGQISFEKGINQFSDMTFEEVVANYTGFSAEMGNDTFDDTNNATTFSIFDPESPPPLPPLTLNREDRVKRQSLESIDWRTYGIITPVKYQGRCGSCTLFSATACLESSWALWKRGPLLDLSEQELLDCIPKGNGHLGCGGNDYQSTMRYQVLRGQGYEKDYNYTEKEGMCMNVTSISKGMRFYQVRKDEESLKQTVDDYGPVGVAIHVGDPFIEYDSGILDYECNGDLNHAALVVGFGSEGGKDYWLLKNSWGDWWGEDGYFRLRRNHKNLCKIVNSAFFMTA